MHSKKQKIDKQRKQEKQLNNGTAERYTSYTNLAATICKLC